ncbi:LemA family protein [Abyssibacter profundi]|uniref:LemA family protein n=1 Tax=Abyssibacter profundi TaxID=2182787 RepID=A0A383XPL1_9GAMM|nr:LemA family protein [Abyssibacter profundi]MBV61698.1 LemA family protein [Nevskiales bacterium]PWN54565.1 LemA family protein [Abyssibacter profundi]
MESASSAISTFVFWGIALGAVLYAIIIYNNLVNLKHAVSKAWSNIDVLLKQRHDELPKLIETCKQYMKFEQDTLEKVMQARSAAQAARANGDVKGVGQAETQMRLGLGNLFAVAEAYPELKANQSFQQLQARISGLENAIADRREFYNETVNNNNVRIEQVPDVLIARIFNFQPADLLEFSEAEKADVDVRALFS